jgi:23S rRNA (guanine2445-N2)-methyltransferase / 23S rRNA (guanine2069-N7)-methyltransferase
MKLDLFASCPKGLEYLLRDELTALGAVDARETLAGVKFSGDFRFAMRACLQSRLASRILLVLARFAAPDADALYDAARKLPWHQWLGPRNSFIVDVSGSAPGIAHTGFAALRVKDAIVDQHRELSVERPNVDADNPAVRIRVYLHPREAAIMWDLSGHALHERGWRTGQGDAPIKENLAAALLIRAKWPERAARGEALIDPMCGAGTILMEALAMAAHVAPGLKSAEQRGFGYYAHPKYQLEEESAEIATARAQADGGLALLHGTTRFFGVDEDENLIFVAKRNLAAAGFSAFVHLAAGDASTMTRPEGLSAGLVLTNPPYGERLGTARTLVPLYRAVGAMLGREFAGFGAALISSDPELLTAVNLPILKRYAIKNGALDCTLALFDTTRAGRVVGTSTVTPAQAAAHGSVDALNVNPSGSMEPRVGRGDAGSADTGSADARAAAEPVGASATAASGFANSNVPHVPASVGIPPLSPGAQMVANRIEKNLRRLKNYLTDHKLSCYRAYDADLPEYCAAIDVYDGKLHIQEYLAPADIPEDIAAGRLRELVAGAQAAFGLGREFVYLKTRRREKGGGKYRRQREATGDYFEVTEGGHIFWVNLDDFLDSGLFLDSRSVRQRIQKNSRDKRFLNLFCYTASATIYAAKGGARSSLSIDLSPTYTHWAAQNFELNLLDTNAHSIEQSDVMAWLDWAENQPDAKGAFDLIYLDPPTFSNSKRTDSVLDTQRDHAHLIGQSMQLLSDGGELIFVTNAQKFKLDPVISEVFMVDDFSLKSIPPDFERDAKIHKAFSIRHSHKEASS